MSKVELAMRADDPGVLNAWKKTKKGSSKVNNEGQHMDCNEPNVDMGEVYCEIISIIFLLQEAYSMHLFSTFETSVNNFPTCHEYILPNKKLQVNMNLR